MRVYLFFCRLAFIFNLFFLIAIIMQWAKMDQTMPAVFAVMLVAYILAVFLINPLVNLIGLLLLLAKKHPQQTVPRWLLWTNFIFFLLQLCYIFLLNDSFYY